MTLHILRDPSAYLDLDHSIACSHLESLVARVQHAQERRDKGYGYRLPRVSDSAKWRAFQQGTLEEPRELNGYELEIRRTDRRLIVGRL